MPAFSLKFDSDHGDVDFSNAISIDDLGELLKSLYSAIGASKGDKIILSAVVDNCYELDFQTKNPVIPGKVQKLGIDIAEKSELELTAKESRFKSCVAKSLKPNWFMDILNEDGVSVVRLPYGFNERSVDIYYSTKNIEGFITEIGDKDLNAKGLHIYISGHTDFRVFLSIEQHDELMRYYRNQQIRAKVRLKKSLQTNKILSATLIRYKPKSVFNFPYNLNDIDFSDITFVHG